MAMIFLSYSHEDKKIVLKLKKCLEDAGHSLWWDEDNIEVGNVIPQAVEIGIQACDYFALLLTKNSEKSAWVQRELATFLTRDLEEKNDRILPLKFDDCELPVFGGLLKSIRHADFTKSFEIGCKSLIRRIDQTKHEEQTRISNDDYNRLLLAIDCSIRAGQTAMMFYNNSLENNLTLDDRKNAATQADKAAQNKIEPLIQFKYERDEIISEETHKNGNYYKINEKGYTWVIDPLDGTNNFVNRIPLFCSGIGLLKNGKPYIGAVYEPVSNEVYYAIDGQQTRRWKVSTGETDFAQVDKNIIKLKESLVGAHISSRPAVANKLFQNNFLLELSKRSKHIRTLGCGLLAMTYVATGRLQVFFQYDSYIWDQVAGVVLVKNAGGLIKEIATPFKEWTYETRDVLVCSQENIMKDFSKVSLGTCKQVCRRINSTNTHNKSDG